MLFKVFETQPGLARLAWNENPYGPSPRVYAAVEEATRLSGYYADSGVYLANMVAERHRLSKEQVLVSIGSIENLALAALAWGGKGTIVSPDLFWDNTTNYAESKGVKVRRIPLKSDMQIDLAAMEAAIDDSVSLVHLCNPNNPTGLLLDPDALRAFCRRLSAKTTLLIDEAYNEITNDPDRNSVIDLVREGHNILVSRTFSKIFGMAGMRIGYMMSTPANIEVLDKNKLSWIPAPSLAAAIAAYDDEAFLAHSKSKLIEAREMVASSLKSHGVEFLPSQTNFIYVNVGVDAEAFRQRMEGRGILIRGIYRSYTQWSRVSMGQIQELERYTKALPEVLSQMKAEAL